MPLVRSGLCNHCGKCCKPPIMVENPMIVLGEDRCKFYIDTENTYLYGHCLIYGRGRKRIASVKDIHGNKITSEQIRWFNDNCLDFPRVEDAGKFALPPKCSFSFEVA